jgi:hypothetical protein
MGTWGIGTFDNDDALDWFEELEAEGLQVAGSAIQVVLDLSPEYLESSVCANALAAAEVVAALRGRPSADLPDKVAAWVRRYPGDPGEELTVNARHVTGWS